MIFIVNVQNKIYTNEEDYSTGFLHRTNVIKRICTSIQIDQLSM